MFKCVRRKEKNVVKSKKVGGKGGVPPVEKKIEVLF